MAARSVKRDAVVAAAFGVRGRVIDKGVWRRIELSAPGTWLRPAALGWRVSKVGAQVEIYCREPRHRRVLALAEQGTAFVCGVWHDLCDPVAGANVGYVQLVDRLGRGVRAVGGDGTANPVPAVAPCHGRDALVVGA
jgi:O6-methylguanine-DNA--protein-cysteine methyltransferase